MLIEEINRYIALRRSLGFKLKETAKNLAWFGQFVEARGERHVRTATAVAWAEGASTPDTRYRRITDVIRLATFLHAEDAAHEIPPEAFKAHRPSSFLTSSRMMNWRVHRCSSVRQLNESSPVRREIYAVLFGLIASTGLRISETLNLTLSDVLPDGILHIRKTKFGKSRMVPLHPTVMPILDRYLELRLAVAANDDHLFLSEGKRKIYYSVPQKVFHEILAIAAIAPGRSRRPRIHDLRHTFATRVLEKSGAGREAIARNAVALMTYMGHSNLRYTYWYLHRTPELLAEISAAAEELLTEGGS